MLWPSQRLRKSNFPAFHVEQSIDRLDLLQTSLQGLGLSLSAEIAQAQLRFLDLVLAKNEVMNLTSITDPQESVVKHLTDGLAPLAMKSIKAQVAGKASLIWGDLGSGAGFPGISLALAVAEAQMHLVEATAKKAHFLDSLAAELGLLRRLTVHNQRLEAVGAALPVPRGTSLRGQLDAVFVRGLSHLASVIELSLPLLKVGGLLVAYKGPKAEQELLESARALKELKTELVEDWRFELPVSGGQRSLLILEKKGETPRQYPRINGLPQKEPLH